MKKILLLLFLAWNGIGFAADPRHEQHQGGAGRAAPAPGSHAIQSHSSGSFQGARIQSRSIISRHEHHQGANVQGGAVPGAMRHHHEGNVQGGDNREAYRHHHRRSHDNTTVFIPGAIVAPDYNYYDDYSAPYPYTSNEAVSSFYDENGNLIYFYIDANGETIYYYYDEYGDLISFTLDANGNAIYLN